MYMHPSRLQQFKLSVIIYFAVSLLILSQIAASSKKSTVAMLEISYIFYMANQLQIVLLLYVYTCVYLDADT